jgi:signal transduction histidine kinase
MARTARPRGTRGSSRVTWNEIEQLRRRVRELELTRERLSRLYFTQVEAGKTRTEKMHRLLEVVTQLNSTLELDALLAGIVRAVQVTIGFRVVLLRVLDPDSHALRARAFAGLDSVAMAKLEAEDVPLDTFLTWLSDEFRVGRSYFISHTHSFSRRLPEGVRVDLGKREPWEWHEDDVLFVPLYTKTGDIVGYLSVDDPADRLVPSRETIELLEVFANHMVVALDNARLYQSLDEHSRRLEDANTRLGELTRLKSNFLSAISHELRTPLTSIRAYTDSLRDASPTGGAPSGDPEAWQHSLDVLTDESARLEALIDSVLSFSALESGAGPQTTGVDLGALVRECAGLLAPAARTKGVTLELELPGAEVALEADRELLKQLLLQLGGNAVKFTPAGGQVVVGLTSEDRGARLSVRDTGIGIPVEEQGRIFERFYQIDGGSTRHYGGTGLGLAICKSVAEWHGGHISVQSRPGQGSCFAVHLPANPHPRAEVLGAGRRRREGGDQPLGLAVEMVAQVLDAPRALLLARQTDGDLVPRAVVGVAAEEIRGLRLHAGEGIAGRVLETGEPYSSADAGRDPAFIGHRREAYREGQVLAVPVRAGERDVGVLVVGLGPADNPEVEERTGGARPGSAGKARMALLLQLAERVGTVLACVENTRRTEAETQVAGETLKSVLVHLRRDRRNAADRVRYAGLVARALGMGEREAAQVEFAALVQDVALSRPEVADLRDGEIAPSEADAMRAIAAAPPGVLAERLERELERRAEQADLEEDGGLRRHPEAGVEILAPLQCDGPVRQMILAHHEWVSGLGYPKGLKGNQIPLGARVLAVVDGLESLLVGRVGRPGVSVEEAVDELRRLGGQRFDAKVVGALVDVLAVEGRLEPGDETRARAA